MNACQNKIEDNASKNGADILPNIFLFLADDMTWKDCSVYGNMDVKTPHLQSLADNGMTFHNMFTATAMCAPTRQQLYTGIYPVRNGAYPNHSQVHSGVKSLVHHFKAQGYQVALIGKKHFGPQASFPFEYLGGKGSDKGGNSTDINLEFIDPVINSDKPFVLILAQNQPHLPWTRGNPSQYNADELTIPEYLVDTPFTREELTKYYAEITYMDSLLGVCLNKIEIAGKTDNTISIFTSEQGSTHPFAKWTCYDRGLKTGFIAQWPGKIEKGSKNEALCQYVDVVPTLLEAIGVKSELVNTGITDFNGKNTFDGKSFLPILLGKEEEHADMVYGVHTTVGINNGSENYPVRSVRTKAFKYIRNLSHEIPFQNNETELEGKHYPDWFEATKNDSDLNQWISKYQYRPYEELYDIINDPWEKTNLAENANYDDIRSKLSLALDKWMLQQGDSGIITELKAPERMAKN